jgi:hypothetical protein
LETRLFSQAEIPWDELAFETVRRSLRYFFADRESGRYVMRIEDVGPVAHAVYKNHPSADQ